MFEIERKTDWYYWTPRRKKRKMKYVCALSNKKSLCLEAIVASDNPKKDYNLNMHKSQITDYQWETNCKKIEDEDLINRLNLRFNEYKVYWHEMKMRKEAKALLMRGSR